MKLPATLETESRIRFLLELTDGHDMENGLYLRKTKECIMSYEMTGKVKKVMDLMTFDSGFTKREFVITTDEQYPQDVKFETVRDKTNLCDKLEEGQEVTVHFDVRGNEYKDRFYVNLNAWRVQAGESSGAATPTPSSDSAPLDTDLPESAAADDENYPF